MKKLFIGAAAAITLLLTAAPAYAHDAVLSVSCQEGIIQWNVNPDYPQEGPVKVKSISGPPVLGITVGTYVPDAGLTFSADTVGTVTIGLKWEGDNFQKTVSKTYEGPCVPVTTTTTVPPTTTTTLPPTTTTTLPPTTTTLPPTTTTVPAPEVPSTTVTAPPAVTTTTPPTAVVVEDAPSPAPLAELPKTGSSTVILAGVALFLIALGLAFRASR